MYTLFVLIYNEAKGYLQYYSNMACYFRFENNRGLIYNATEAVPIISRYYLQEYVTLQKRFKNL
jgi:hypothetical protein